MFDISEQLEKALKWLLVALPRFCVALFMISFRPTQLASRSVTDVKALFSPQVFLALAAYVLTKTARVAIFSVLLILSSCSRGCSGDTYPDDKTVLTDYFKSQITWPKTEDILVTALPIVLLVLALSWLFGRIRYLKSARTPEFSYITLALCYTVGAQYVLVTPVATATSLGLAALAIDYNDSPLAGYVGWLSLLVFPVTLVGWPCCMYYRFLRGVYTLRVDPNLRKKRTRLVLVATGLLGVTLPPILVFGAAYPLAQEAVEEREQPVIRAALLSAEWDSQLDTADVSIRILNNTGQVLLLRGDEMGLDTVDGEYYCGPSADRSGVEIAPHATGSLRAKLKHVAGFQLPRDGGSVSSINTGSCSTPAGLAHRLFDSGGRVWVHSYAFDGAERWLTANLTQGVFSRPASSPASK